MLHTAEALATRQRALDARSSDQLAYAAAHAPRGYRLLYVTQPGQRAWSCDGCRASPHEVALAHYVREDWMGAAYCRLCFGCLAGA